MKKFKVTALILALAMMMSLTAFASPPVEFDGSCIYCGGGSEAIGTRDWWYTDTETDLCDVTQWIDVQVQFECWTCFRRYTETISIPYTVTCTETGKVTYTEDADRYGLASPTY